MKGAPLGGGGRGGGWGAPTHAPQSQPPPPPTPGAAAFDPAILLTSAKTGLGLDRLLARLDELLADRVRAIRVLLPYDALGLAAPLRDRGSVQAEEYRPDGLYLEAIAKREELHLFEMYMV